MKVLFRIFLIILVIGGLNRALVGWFDLNLVTKIFPDVVKTIPAADANTVATTVTTLNKFAMMVYTLVGFSALWVFIAKIVRCCKKAK